MDQTEATQPSSDQAKEKAQEVAGQAQERAQQATGQAKVKLREQVDQRSTQAGEQVTSAVHDVRTVGEELQRQGKDKPAQLANQAAERAERLGDYLKQSDADRILGDLEDFGRRQPWVVAAGGLALGFLGSRFLKASSQKRYEASSQKRYEASSQGRHEPAREEQHAPGPTYGVSVQAEQLGSRGV